jgi:hypothetical protein
MQFRNHVVVVVTVLVLGVSVILGVSVGSTVACPGPTMPSAAHNVATAEVCTGMPALACIPRSSVSYGPGVRSWGVQVACFEPTP